MPNKFHYVYVLRSEKVASKHYTGCTQDLVSRLKKHNEGGCPHTSKYRPWHMETCLAFRDKAKPIAFEAYLQDELPWLPGSK